MRRFMMTILLAASSALSNPALAQDGAGQPAPKLQERKGTAGKIDTRYECEKLKKTMKQQETDKRSVEAGVEVKFGEKPDAKPNLYTTYHCDQYDN